MFKRKRLAKIFLMKSAVLNEVNLEENFTNLPQLDRSNKKKQSIFSVSNILVIMMLVRAIWKKIFRFYNFQREGKSMD